MAIAPVGVVVAARGPRGSVALLIHWMAFIFSFNNSAVQLLVPLYALHRGYSALTIGILAALPSVANVTLRLTFGRLSDRHGETKLLKIGGLFYVAAALGLLGSELLGLAAFAGAQLLQGVGRSVFWTVGQTYVTKLPLRRGQHLGLFNGASNLGMLLGMSAAGVLAVSLGYPGAFAVIMLLTLVYSALTLSLPAIASPVEHERTGQAGSGGDAAAPRLGLLWRAACCSFVSGGTFALAGSFYPVYLAQLGYNARSIGLLVMLLAAGMFCVSFVSHRLVASSVRLERLALLFITSAGLGLATVPAFRHWLPLAALLLAAGFCAGGCNLVYQLSVLRYSAWHARGVTMAQVGLFGNVALLVLPTSIGIALKWTTLEAALVGAGVLVIVLGLTVGASTVAAGRSGAVRGVTPGGRGAHAASGRPAP